MTRLESELLPSTRAARGEEFDDVRVWIGSDPLTRRAIAISARTVRDASGGFAGAALALSDITDLMRAIQARDDFLAAVSHELRTPLTSVVGHLEVLLDHGDLDDGPVRQLRVIERNAARLHRLVSDLLDSAEHRGGPVRLTRSPVDLTQLVGEALESAAPAARASGIVLGSTLVEGLVAVVDPQRLRQVIDNLISNAVKYTDPGGRVDVRLDAVDGEVRLEVSRQRDRHRRRRRAAPVQPLLPLAAGRAPGTPRAWAWASASASRSPSPTVAGSRSRAPSGRAPPSPCGFPSSNPPAPDPGACGCRTTRTQGVVPCFRNITLGGRTSHRAPTVPP